MHRERTRRRPRTTSADCRLSIRDHEQDLGGQRRIARNERQQFPDLHVVAREQIQQSQHDWWKGGNFGQQRVPVRFFR
jgi:hypothetical protein